MAIGHDESGICPACAVPVHFTICYPQKLPGDDFKFSSPGGQHLIVAMCSCPRCASVVLVARHHQKKEGEGLATGDLVIWPAAARPAPEAVTTEDPDVASDMEEAASVLPISPKASAALSRRALQHMLIERGGVTKSANLVSQIAEAKPSLPSALGENVDEIRKIGNYAAHPKKSQHTGEIVPVEEGEAEYTLEVLWDLADHYYTKPARYRKTRDQFAGKGEAEGGASEAVEVED